MSVPSPSRSDRCVALALLAAAPALALLAPAPWTTGDAAATGDPFAALVAAVGVLAWACTGYLLLALGATAGSHLPGALGRAAHRTSRRLAPAALRTLLRVAVGVTAAGTALGTAAPSYAAPSAPPPVSAAPAAGFDWPTLSAGPAAVTTAPPAAVPAARGGAHRPGAPVVVRAGDSLWAIAARALGPQATPARVAQAWPRWWHANRDVVGDQPDLIHPGTRLAPPAP